jgi:hypothetical protein
MAKKAGGNTTTSWIPLREAKALVVKAYEASQLAERLLKDWLGEERVRWSCKLFEPARVSELASFQRECAAGGVVHFVAKTAYSEGDPAFWRTSLEINWEESSAREMYVMGGTRAYGIRVAREDVLALLPEEPSEIAPPLMRQKTSRRITLVTLAKTVANELWPSGPPKLTSAELLRQLGNELDRRGICVSDTTKRRALGLR